MEYGGYPGGQRPGFAPPPSTFGYTAGAMGYGNMPQYQRQQAVQAGGLSLGASTLNFATSTAPGMFGAAAMAGGVAGNFLEIGGRSAMTRGIGRAMNFLDPSTIVMEAGIAGAGAGWGAGAGLGSAMGMGAFGTGAMGVAGGAMGAAALAAPFAGLAYGGYKAGQFALNNMYQGGQNFLQGQSFANQMGGSVAPRMNMSGQGMQMGTMLRDISGSTGLETGDIGRVAKELDAQKLFQTTRDMKEFKDKFSTAMKAIKDIAQITKGSIDDAVKMFGDLRSQGFYNTADVGAQAAVTSARAATTGLGYDTMNAVGGAGAGIARSRGLRGRFGSELASRNVAGVSTALRSGALSEEEVMEMGGVEAVGLQQTETQTRFLSSSRGRAMIAAMMGKGGAPDPGKMRQMLGGSMSLEDLVNRAANSGLGTLQQAGSRESREAMMPYAGASMIQMAMMQQQQLYGNTSKSGILTMLGTMGVGKQEGEALLATTANLPRQMRQEQIEQQNQAARVAADERASSRSISSRLDNFTKGARDSFQDFGAGVVQGVAGGYTRSMEGLMGGRVYRGGDDDILKRALKNKRLRGSLQQSGADTDTLLGGGATSDLRDKYFEYGQTAEGMGMSQADIDAKVKSGELVSLGSTGIDSNRALGSVSALLTAGRVGDVQDPRAATKYISREKLNQVDKARKQGASAVGFDKASQGRLSTQLSRSGEYSDAMGRMEAELGDAVMIGGGVFGGLSAATGGLFGSEQAKQAETLQQGYLAYDQAKQAGILSDKVTFQDFMQDKNLGKGADGQALGKEQIIEQMRKQMKGTAFEGRMGSSKAGGTSAADLQSARATREEGITDFMNKFGSQGLFGSKYAALEKGEKTSGSASGQASALGGKLATDGEIRDLYTRFGKALSAFALPASKQDPAATDEARRIKDELIKKLGPGSEEANEVEDQWNRATEKSAEGQEYAKSLSKEVAGLDEKFQKGALAEHYTELANTAATYHAELGREGADPKLTQLVGALADASDPARGGGIEKRDAAIKDLIKGIGGDEDIKGLSEKDIAAMSKAGISADFGDAVNKLVNGGKIEDVLDDETIAGLTEDQKSALKSGNLGKVVDALVEAGVTTDKPESTVGVEDQEGMEKQYREKNQQFIDSVNALISKLVSAGVIELGKEGSVAPAPA